MWSRHIHRYSGDYKTQYLLATLCAMNSSKEDCSFADFAPWLLGDAEYEAHLKKMRAEEAKENREEAIRRARLVRSG